MVHHGVFPAHPERSAPEPARIRWSTAACVAWLILLVSAAVDGVCLSIATAPPGEGPFGSPVLVLSIFALAVPCGLAEWYVPRVAPYWGLAIAPPYLFGFAWWRMAHPPIGADFTVFGVFFLLVLLAVPTGVSLSAGLSRQALLG